MSQLLINAAQIGKDPNPSNNVHLRMAAPGEVRLSTGNIGTTVIDLFKASSTGVDLLNPTGTTPTNGDSSKRLVTTDMLPSTIKGGKNYFHNGGMQIFQKPYTQLLVAAGQIPAINARDRWSCSVGFDSIGQLRQKQSTLVFDGVSRDSLKTEIALPSTNLNDAGISVYINALSQQMEGIQCYGMNQKPLVVTFLFNTNVTGKFSFSMRTHTPLMSSFVSSFDAVAGVPQRVKINIPANLLSSFTAAGSGLGCDVFIGFLNKNTLQTVTENQWQLGNYFTSPDCTDWSNTVGNFVEIAEVKLETGYYATPFEYEDYTIELLKCQRYYQLLTVTGFQRSSVSSAFGGAIIRMPYITKRQIPNISLRTNSTLDTPGLIINSQSSPYVSLNFNILPDYSVAAIYSGGGGTMANVGDYAEGMMIAECEIF